MDLFKYQDLKYSFTNTKEIADFLDKNITKNNKILIIDVDDLVLDDSWKVYLNSYKYTKLVYVSLQNDYISKIKNEIKKKSGFEYLIVNNRFKRFINTTKLNPMIVKENEISIYGFSSDEYYYLYKL
mgnify:CR=1 FL=1